MLTVFFVDDEMSVLSSFKRLFQFYKNQYRFLFFSSPEQALDSGEVPEVLISDSMMPVMSGRVLIHKMKEKHPHLISILMTGEIALEELEEGLHRHDFFLEKPFDAQELLDILKGITR